MSARSRSATPKRPSHRQRELLPLARSRSPCPHRSKKKLPRANPISPSVCWWYLDSLDRRVPVIIHWGKSSRADGWERQVNSAANELLTGDSSKWLDVSEEVTFTQASPFSLQVTLYRSKKTTEEIYFGGAASSSADRSRACALAALVAAEDYQQDWWCPDLQALVGGLRRLKSAEALNEDLAQVIRERDDLKTRSNHKLEQTQASLKELKKAKDEAVKLANETDHKLEETQADLKELKKAKDKAVKLAEDTNHKLEETQAALKELKKAKEALEGEKAECEDRLGRAVREGVEQQLQLEEEARMAGEKSKRSRIELGWQATMREAKVMIAMDRAQLTRAQQIHSEVSESITCLRALDSCVFIGNFDAAKNATLIKAQGIQRILNVSSDELSEMQGVYKAHHIEAKHLKLHDKPWEDILSKLKEASDFLDAAKSAGQKVLVHCAEGRNRSGVVVVSYLMLEIMRNKKVSAWKSSTEVLNLFGDAWSAIAADRWPILTQASFRFQLIVWANCRLNAETALKHRLWHPLRIHSCIVAQMREELMRRGSASADAVTLQFADRFAFKKVMQKLLQCDLAQKRQKILDHISKSVNHYLNEKDSTSATSSESDEGP